MGLAKVAGMCRPGRYDIHGPWDHMSFLSTNEELKQGYNNSNYAKNPDYKNRLKLRSAAMNEMKKLECKVEETMSKIRISKNKERTLEEMPKKTTKTLEKYYYLSKSVEDIYSPANEFVKEMQPIYFNLSRS